MVLYLHAGRDGRCNPSVSTIEDLTKLPRRTVTRALFALGKAGIFGRDKSPGRANVYHLTTRVADVPTTGDAGVPGEDSELGTPVTATRDAGVHECAPGRDVGVSQVGTQASPKQEEQQQELNSVLNSGSPHLAAEFEEWWSEYGRVGDKARAGDLYRWWRTAGQALADDLLTAAVRYRQHCAATTCMMKHAATFLAKPGKGRSPIWPEWAAGEVHGPMDVGAASHLSDVLEAGARAFGLTTGGDNGNGLHACGHDGRRTFEQGRSTGAVGGRADARRSLPPGELEE